MAKSHILTSLRFAKIVGGVAGNHTLTGLKLNDRLLSVLQFEKTAANITDLVDLTAEFTITADDTINNAAGTDTSTDALLIIYVETGAGRNYGANAGKDY